MNYALGDIVLIVHYPIPEAIGREAEVIVVNTHLLPPDVWYCLIDCAGKQRAARHSWLRKRSWGEFQKLVDWQPQQVTVGASKS